MTVGIATIVIDEERAPLVQLGFRLYATGNWSIGELVAHLGEQGLRSNPRHQKTVPKPLGKSQVQRMLRNRYYLGKVLYKGQEHEGQHDALAEQKTFDRVQELLDSRRQSESRYRTHNHYLKGCCPAPGVTRGCTSRTSPTATV